MSILLIIGIVILVFWLLGFVVFRRLFGCLIHIALAVGLIMVAFWLLHSVLHLF
jgi:hypothetical protein